MYIPKDFSQTDFEAVKDFIAGSPLANIMTLNGDSVEICPALLLWQVDEQNPLGYLMGHVAKVNPIVKIDAKNWKVVFTSQGHYISPNWYPTKAMTHKEVPTWNYQSVIFSVTPQLITDATQIKQIVATMTDFFEHQLKQTNPSHEPWSLSDAPSDYINAMCRAIVGVKLTIHNFEAKFKLSQNKTLDNQQGVIDGLTKLQSASADNMATLINHLFKE
ncbi:FMN-binding negative transcriptional regulator [Moraxella osloensis]|nr:FMN-binding negative transcriptional regulator [Moraxella osloensis]MDK1669038.1 FMN-binding negative transcriptional regulator [Moraxella osloensis]